MIEFTVHNVDKHSSCILGSYFTLTYRQYASSAWLFFAGLAFFWQVNAGETYFREMTAKTFSQLFMGNCKLRAYEIKKSGTDCVSVPDAVLKGIGLQVFRRSLAAVIRDSLQLSLR